jgi:hypothetical protein
MNNQEFIDAIKITVVQDSIESIESVLKTPPGKSPEKKRVELSEWYHTLDDTSKQMVKNIINESVETSVFSFLCVLDGVRAIEKNEDKGKLDLYYEKDETLVLLNNQNEEYLHNLL